MMLFLVLSEVVKQALNLYKQINHRLSMEIEHVRVQNLFLILSIEIKQSRGLTPAEKTLLLHPEAQIEILAVILVA
jgi:hypothetical protein